MSKTGEESTPGPAEGQLEPKDPLSPDECDRINLKIALRSTHNSLYDKDALARLYEDLRRAHPRSRRRKLNRHILKEPAGTFVQIEAEAGELSAYCRWLLRCRLEEWMQHLSSQDGLSPQNAGSAEDAFPNSKVIYLDNDIEVTADRVLSCLSHQSVTAWIDRWIQPRRLPTEDRPQERHSRLYTYITVTVYLMIQLALLLAAGWVLFHTAELFVKGVPVTVTGPKGTLSTHLSRDFIDVFPSVLGGLILAVIILELLETVYQQIAQAHERLTFQLVLDFFVIGTVSAIRHILVIGAELSLAPASPTAAQATAQATDRAGMLNEFRTNTIFIGVLVIAMVLVVIAEHHWETLERVKDLRDRRRGRVDRRK